MLWYAVAISAAALAVPTKEIVEQEEKKLDGEWTLVSGVDDGKRMAASAIRDTKLTFSGDNHVVVTGRATYLGSHQIDPTQNPKTINILDKDGPFKAMIVLGIYQLSGDELQVCYSLPGKDRPKDFVAKEGTGYRSFVWKRTTKK